LRCPSKTSRQVAHIGTYALAERVDEGAHIAGYALADLGGKGGLHLKGHGRFVDDRPDEDHGGSTYVAGLYRDFASLLESAAKNSAVKPSPTRKPGASPGQPSSPCSRAPDCSLPAGVRRMEQMLHRLLQSMGGLGSISVW
jgi:hypothetical protein